MTRQESTRNLGHYIFYLRDLFFTAALRGWFFANFIKTSALIDLLFVTIENYFYVFSVVLFQKFCDISLIIILTFHHFNRFRHLL